MLRLEADSRATWESATVLALEASEEVAGIDLDAWLGGIGLHHAAALEVLEDSSEAKFTWLVLVDGERVVVARAVAKLLVIIIDALANEVRSAEVEGSALDRSLFTEWDADLVDRQVAVGIYGEHLSFNGRGDLLDTSEVEVRMVGEVAERQLVGGSLVVEANLIIIGELVAHLYLEGAGEAFFAIGTGIAEHERLIVDLLGIPNYFMEALGTAMQAVGAIVECELIFFATESELGTSDSIAITADGCAEGWLGTINKTVDAVHAQYDVGKYAIAVGHHQ